MPDLTTLAAVKEWLSVSGYSDDKVLSDLITQVSGTILSYVSRPDILKRQYTDRFTGSGAASKMLRNYPVISVASLKVGGISVPGGDGLKTGYWTDPDEGVPPGRLQMVYLNGYQFDRTLCEIIYQAGYAITDEQHAAAASVSVLAPNGAWARDEGVTYADGRKMSKVTAAPAAGQYAVESSGQYVFSVADTDASVLIDYSYVPSVLAEACIEIVAERYKYRDRIGQASKNISGEIISFSLKDMPDYTKLALRPFRKLVPV